MIMLSRQEKAEIMGGQDSDHGAVQVPSMLCKLKRHAHDHAQKARKAEIMGGQDDHGCRASTKHAVQVTGMSMR
ncbi:MAG: hypothetical protein LBT59_09580 [Clostridiales bacterium]|jgi:hypothetical protein|nr:hypothetical protein [Clostridiales bacterium]